MKNIIHSTNIWRAKGAPVESFGRWAELNSTGQARVKGWQAWRLWGWKAEKNGLGLDSIIWYQIDRIFRIIWIWFGSSSLPRWKWWNTIRLSPEGQSSRPKWPSIIWHSSFRATNILYGDWDLAGGDWVFPLSSPSTLPCQAWGREESGKETNKS